MRVQALDDRYPRGPQRGKQTADQAQCGGSSNRNRHFAEMRAAFHMGKRLFRLVE